MSKRRNLIIAVLVAALCTFVAFGCTPKKQPEITYTVTFEANGGEFSDGSTQTKISNVKADATVAAPAVSRINFDFDGWHTDLAATNKVDLATYKINSNISFFAGWKPSGEITPPPTEEKTLTGIEVTKQPTKTEYIQGQTVSFDGLEVTAKYSDNTTEVITSGYTLDPTTVDTTTAGDKTVTVTYEGKTATFTIKVIAKAVTSLEMDGDLIKSNYNLGDTFNPNGLSFTAVYNDGSRTPIANSAIKFESAGYMANDGSFTQAGENIEVTAKYDGVSASEKIIVNVVQKFYVSFDSNVTGLGVAATDLSNMPNRITGVEDGSTVNAPSVAPELKGYTFDGWYKEATCVNAWNFTTDTVTSATTLFAKWTANNIYTITYDENGGTLVSGAAANPTSFTVTNNKYDTITLGNLQKEHYNFSGWYTAETGGDKKTTLTYADIPSNGTSIELYAQFTPKTYNITFDLTTGVTGCTVAKKTPSAAVWKTTYTYGDEVLLPQASDLNITKPAGDTTNYGFEGWRISGASANISGTKLTKNNGGTGDVTLVVQISSVPLYNFIFDLNDGTGNTETVTVREGSAVTPIGDPTRLGYTFDDWYVSAAAGSAKYVLTDPVNSDNVTVYAKWTENNYTVAYNLDSKATAQPNPVSYKITDGEVTLSDPTGITTGYRFTGWYTAATGGSQVTKLDSNRITGKADGDTITIYARFSNTWTITFNANAGSDTVDGIPAQKTVAYGSTIAAVTDPTRTGYTFGGWYTEAACTTEWVFGASGTTVPASNVTLYAKWTENAPSGWYLMPANTELTKDNASSYVLTNGTISNLTLGENSEFVIFNYNHDNGDKEYRNTSNTVTPSAAMTVNRTGNVYKVTNYTAGASARWTATSTNSTLTLTMVGYYTTYDRNGAAAALTTATPANGTAYVFGNFTNKAYTAQWAESTAIGGKFYFRNVSLRQFDKFDIRYNTKTVTGESITATGNYNIVFDPNGNGTISVYPVLTDTLTVTVNTANVFVGGSVSKTNLTVKLGSTTIAAGDYDLVASTPVSGANASKVIVIYHGTVVEQLYTATDVVETGVTIAFKSEAKYYYVGDTLNANDFTVKVQFNNGTEQPLATGFTLSLVGTGDTDDLFASKQGSVQVSYKTFTATCNADIYNKVTQIGVTVEKAGGISFIEGNTFALDEGDITVTAYFNGGAALSTTIDSSKYTLNPAIGTKLSTVGTTTVTVTYTGTTLSDSFDVTVRAKSVTDLTFSGTLGKTAYKVGEAFSSTGITVTAAYDNGTTENVTSRVSFVNATYYDGKFVQAGTGIKLSASFGGMTVELPTELTVTDVLSSIAVTTVPTLPRVDTDYEGYVAGDEFSYAGMVVTATYNSGIEGVEPHTGDVTGYTVSIAENTALTAGEKTVTVTYNGKTDKFTINVAVLAVQSISVSGTPAKQYAQTTFNPSGLTFTAFYNNGTSQTIVDTENISYSGEDYNLADGGFTTTGTDITITATYSGKTCEISGIEVVFTILRSVTYVTANGDYAVTGAPANGTVENNTVLTRPADPSCAGFTFDGWFTDEDRTVEYDFSAQVKANLKLYAKWTAIEYTINFVDNEGTLDESDASLKVTIENIASATLPTPTAPSGRRFVAWKNGNATVTAPLSLDLFADGTTLTLTAEYEDYSEVTVTFNLNYAGSSPIVTDPFVSGTVIPAAQMPADPERDDYTFEGWFESDMQTEWNSGDAVSANIIVYAKWTYNHRYIVTVDGVPTSYDLVKETEVTDENADREFTASQVLNEGALVTFVIDGEQLKGFYMGPASHGVTTKSEGGQIVALETTASGTFDIYVRHYEDGAWTIVVDDGEEDEIQANTYYLVGGTNGWKLTAGFELTETSTGVYTISKSLAQNTEFKIVKSTADKEIDWNNGIANEFNPMPTLEDTDSRIAIRQTSGDKNFVVLLDCEDGNEYTITFTESSNKVKIEFSGEIPDTIPTTDDGVHGYLVGKISALGPTTNDNKGYEMLWANGQCSIENVYLQAGDQVKVRAGDAYATGTTTIRGGAAKDDNHVKVENGYITIVDSGYYSFYYHNTYDSYTKCLWIGYAETFDAPDYVIPTNGAIFKFNDGTLIIQFDDIPTWGDPNSAFAYRSGDAWSDRYALDGKSTYTIDADLSEVSFMIGFTQGGGKNTKPISGTEFTIGKVNIVTSKNDAGTDVSWDPDWDLAYVITTSDLQSN